VPGRILSNNIALPERRDTISKAVLQAIGDRHECWEASIYEPPEEDEYVITIEGPDGSIWTRNFFGPDEQTPESIRQVVEQALAAW
jgi:hypothetical protein